MSDRTDDNNLTIWCSLTGAWPSVNRDTQDCPAELSQEAGGRELGEKYVHILKDMVDRNLFADENYPTRRYPFKCLTDKPIEGIDCVVDPAMPASWWNKIWLFKHAGPGRHLYIDLDTVITGRLEDLIERLKGEPFVLMKDLAPRPLVTTGLFYWEGDHSDIYKDFEKAGFPLDFGQRETFAGAIDANQQPIRKYVGGDAAWFAHKRPHAPFIQHFWPGRIKSYKLDMLFDDWPNDGVNIVCMHGLPRPHHITEGWVPKVWSLGGICRPIWKVIINTTNDRMLENIAINVKDANARLLTIVPPVNDKVLAICGGGPSLGDPSSMAHLRAWKDCGATVWGLNGAYNFLLSKDIVPDGMVMMDARTQNIQFLDNPHGRTTFYLATICDPVMFKKLARYNVMAWHPDIDGLGDVQISVGSGSTVGLRALCLGWILGYRKFQLYGYDSSYRDSEGHAFPQDINKGELDIRVVLNGQEFHCARWMARQCEELRSLVAQLVEAEHCEVTVIGDGLFPYAIKLDSTQDSIPTDVAEGSKEGL